jgi:tRNA-specific 2-thiouridylase
MLGRNIPKNSKILVALSGGVDSAVSASLLKKAGFEVEGAYMRCWSEGPYCSAEQDQADAARVATKLGIPFHVFDFEKEYRQAVIDYFFKEYEAGRTPNPDVMCNKEIKFGLFLDKAKSLGFDLIATGHYARVTNGLGYHLRTGLDKSKDQSYFLYRVGQEQLASAIFPVGHLKKSQVRALATKMGLPVASKPDSTGICFIGPAPIREFLLSRLEKKPGEIVDTAGKVLGEHIGLAFYTIGQREALGVSASAPYYVAEKDLVANRLVVAPIGDEALFKKKFSVKDAHWTAGKEPSLPREIEVKLRYRATNNKAKIKKAQTGLEVELEIPQRAITPGQSAVFYLGDEVIGGAIIDT